MTVKQQSTAGTFAVLSDVTAILRTAVEMSTVSALTAGEETACAATQWILPFGLPVC